MPKSSKSTSRLALEGIIKNRKEVNTKPINTSEPMTTNLITISYRSFNGRVISRRHTPKGMGKFCPMYNRRLRLQCDHCNLVTEEQLNEIQYRIGIMSREELSRLNKMAIEYIKRLSV